jgi:hypothetical protein
MITLNKNRASSEKKPLTEEQMLELFELDA